MSEITLENIDYFHAKGTPYQIKALDGVNLNIREGRITGIIGHTGSGKSTLGIKFCKALDKNWTLRDNLLYAPNDLKRKLNHN